jgi:hypothetical protein
MTFAQFLDEQDKRMVLFGIAAAKKGGGTKQSGGDHTSAAQMVAKPNFKVVNPAKIFCGMPVPGEIFGRRKPASQILGKK